MPLINTSEPIIDTPIDNNAIDRLLGEAGLKPSAVDVFGKEKDLKTQLNENHLGLPALLVQLQDIMINGGSDQTRLRAIENALKLHGVMRDDTVKQIPSFTIVINDGGNGGINPILIPREASI